MHKGYKKPSFDLTKAVRTEPSPFAFKKSMTESAIVQSKGSRGFVRFLSGFGGGLGGWE